ncbi:MarR family transcriptional regulator [archaeon]|nr:MAG: MarR family transcriptional regulator [archaeon]
MKLKYSCLEMSYMKLVSQNYSGLSIVIMSAVAFAILLSVSLDYAEITHSLCDAPLCSVYNHVPAQAYIGFGALIISAFIGIYITFRQHKVEKTQTLSKAKMNKMVSGLQADDKKVFDEIARNDGSVFQNDLISSTGFSKVKVSRILDRLETKGIVERRRRGMSNIVVLR